MTVSPSKFRRLLSQFRFDELFNQFGWDRPDLRPQCVSVGGHDYRLIAVAQKRGVVALTCSPDRFGNIPPHADRLSIEREVERIAFEHLIVFTDDESTIQTWQWISREPSKPTALRTHTWRRGMDGESLRQKLEAIIWNLEDEEAITLTDVIKGLRTAFDRERITKRFYERFKCELERFSGLIDGILPASSRTQYASVMLNRIMFIYFVQKKGFLDGDPCYLRNRLHHIRECSDHMPTVSYYRSFLRPLFHEGLNKAIDNRDPEMHALIGTVPYFNGGIFEAHEVELRNPDIDIPNSAFDMVFDFFDSYDWHLDDRPLANDSEVNPDVLGYIFEKYINQREMGAYYTKEDITDYICKNTIVSHILTTTIDQCEVAFSGENSCWNLLVEQPSRYIYSSIKKGIGDFRETLNVAGESVASLDDHDFIFDASQGDERVLLPRETEQLFHHRRRRCLQLIEQLRSGEVRSVAAMVTLNLDLKQFLQDIIDNCSDATLLRAVWYAITGLADPAGHNRRGISVLDPTCGSGAFLFAALSVLEALYDACLDRMSSFIEDARSAQKAIQLDFQESLHEVDSHPSRRYFVYKSIILNNLFGVDIMPEAVEVCKLRMFLKLVSQVENLSELEPLPDLDFNIRVGNALVGYISDGQFEDSALSHSQALLAQEQHAKLRSMMVDVSSLHNRFRMDQVSGKVQVSSTRKKALQASTRDLGLELDRYMARDYGIDPTSDDFHHWRNNHRPFHWFAEFYDVFAVGGFDVVVGNPPYIAAKKITEYRVKDYVTESCPDIYAWCLERVVSISRTNSWVGMIVPLSLSFSRRFAVLRDLIYRAYGRSWYSHFGRIPSALFSADIRVRNTIHIGTRWGGGGFLWTAVQYKVISLVLGH